MSKARLAIFFALLFLFQGNIFSGAVTPSKVVNIQLGQGCIANGRPAVNPRTNTIFVPATDSGNTCVIDGSTNKVVGFVHATDGLMINPQTNVLFVVHPKDYITAVNASTGQIITQIYHIHQVAAFNLNPLTNMIYVLNTAKLTVVNGSSYKVLTSIPFQTNQHPVFRNSIAVNPFTRLVYVIFPYKYAVINGTTNQVIKYVSLGVKLNAVAINSITNTLYFSDTYVHNSPRIWYVNASNNQVIRYVSCQCGRELDVNPNTNHLYIAQVSSTLVLDGSTGQTIATILGVSGGLAINRKTDTIYAVTNIASMVIISGATNKITSTVALAVQPVDLVANPNTNLIYVTEHLTNTISIINGSTNRVIGNFSFDKVPTIIGEIAENPLKGILYVVDYYYTYSIWAIKEKTGQESILINLTALPKQIVINPKTNILYVIYYGLNKITAIDASTGKVLKNFIVYGTPFFIGINPVTNMLYIPHSFPHAPVLTVVNASNYALVANISGVSGFISIDTKTNMVYALSSQITVINGSNNSVVGSFPTGGTHMAVNSKTDTLYVVNGNVKIINATTGEIIKTIADSSAVGISVDETTNRTYVANSGLDSVSVIY